MSAGTVQEIAIIAALGAVCGLDRLQTVKTQFEDILWNHADYLARLDSSVQALTNFDPMLNE